MFFNKRKYCVCEICHRKYPDEDMTPIQNLGPSLIPVLNEFVSTYDLKGKICRMDMRKLRMRQITSVMGKDAKGLENLEHILFNEEEEINPYDFNQKYQGSLSSGERISQKVTLFIGSWAFMVIFTLLLAIWMWLNTQQIYPHHFDPFPFILLNLFLSCLAAGQAPIILMSQNRLAKRERLRADEDYFINLKSELEVRQLHEKIDEVLKLLKK